MDLLSRHASVHGNELTDGLAGHAEEQGRLRVDKEDIEKDMLDSERTKRSRWRMCMFRDW